WDSARAAFEIALDATLAHAPGDSARSRAYLVDALGRLGREDDARAQWRAAMDEVDRGSARARRGKEAWVRTGWGGALVQLQRWREAIDVLDTPAVHQAMHDDPLPGLRARRFLGVALVREGSSRDRGLHLLASSPAAHGRALEPALRSLAHVSVLVEAELRADAGLWNPDIESRTTTALSTLPVYGAAPRVIGRARTSVERAIEHRTRDGDEPLALALRTLIERCDAI
ncbi:MAG: hypothetical protein M3Y87_30170, partial [Myxococcota bacterium]|nr:hypothetical protein [Myxococcota bacterium]